VAPRRPIVRGDGPRGRTTTDSVARTDIPIEIAIPAIGVEAPVEVLTTVGNRMLDPTGPDVVAWYDDTDDLGPSGNAVFAGHLDDADVGPAVFADLNELARNDRILVTDDDGDVHAYRVVSRRIVSAATGPWDDLTASTDRSTLTLITCAGPWDDALGHYRDRLVVRAVRVMS
jgi:LPXTG-site transpeptidase (sortase) family protein